ncbi:hypothetical protein [Streptomyces longispororuber]|uniref:hypothetical protein n=1 Tax=Streptomyces longispororuber TaxID=68230 RepID=UPI00167E8548|nr:hypothetical protein [Streptomyces longispororuber]
MIFLALIGFCVWMIASEAEQKKKRRAEAAMESARRERLADPATAGAEMTRTARAGDVGDVQNLLPHLPAWPVRDAMLCTAQWLAVLSNGAAVADRAGVPRGTTDEVRALVESALAELASMATKLVSLSQLFAGDWNALAPDIRGRLETGAHHLNGISEAASSLRDSLGFAVAEQHGSTESAASVRRNLDALATAIRQTAQDDAD